MASQLILRVLITLLVVIVLTGAGCAVSSQLQAPSNDTATPVAGLALEPPTSLLAQASGPPRGTNAAGAGYDQLLPHQHTTTVGNNGLFDPTWAAPDHLNSADLAYAIYSLDATGLSGAQTLSSAWALAPAAGDYWIGLADFTRDTWKWFPGPLAAPLAIPDLAPYKAPGGEVLAAVVLTGADAGGLTFISLGTTTPVIDLAYQRMDTEIMGGGGISQLVMVDGAPAFIAIEDSGMGSYRLLYFHAQDAEGSAWNPPVELATDVYSWPALAVVDGNPAVVYPANYGSVLYYRRATDAQGTAWDPPVTVDNTTSGAGQSMNLAVVGGNPAIAYTADGGAPNEDRLLFMRANNAQGSSWPGTPQILEPGYASNIRARDCSFAFIDALPAVAYWFSDPDGGDVSGVRFVMAQDATGLSWSAPVDVLSEPDPPMAMIRNVDLVDVGGYPCVGWYKEDFSGGDSTANFRAASATDGSVWNSADVLLTTVPGGLMNYASFQAFQRADSSWGVLAGLTIRDGLAQDIKEAVSANVTPGGRPDWAGAKLVYFNLNEGGSSTALHAGSWSPSKQVSCYSVDTDIVLALLMYVFFGGGVSSVDGNHQASDINIPVLRMYGLVCGWYDDTNVTNVSFGYVDLPVDLF